MPTFLVSLSTSRFAFFACLIAAASSSLSFVTDSTDPSDSDLARFLPPFSCDGMARLMLTTSKGWLVLTLIVGTVDRVERRRYDVSLTHAFHFLLETSSFRAISSSSIIDRWISSVSSQDVVILVTASGDIPRLICHRLQLQTISKWKTAENSRLYNPSFTSRLHLVLVGLGF